MKLLMVGGTQDTNSMLLIMRSMKLSFFARVIDGVLLCHHVHTD